MQAKEIDWRLIEFEYKIGKPIRDTAARHGVTVEEITAKAKSKKWDLQATLLQREIEARTDRETANRVSLLKEITLLSHKDFITDPSVQQFVGDQASYNTLVNLKHYAGTAKARDLLDDLSKRLEELVGTFGEEEDNLRRLHMCVLIFSKLVDAQKTLYDMERKILKIDGGLVPENAPMNINVNFVE